LEKAAAVTGFQHGRFILITLDLAALLFMINHIVEYSH
jgi:hypothetical protein